MAGLARFSAAPDDPEFYQDPYPYYQRMHGLGPAFVWDDYGWVSFARYESVNALLRERRLGREFAHVMSREAVGLPPVPEHLAPFYAFEAHSMLEREPPVHTRLRRLVNRAFVSRQIERLRPRIERLCHALIDGFEADGAADLLPAYAERIPVIVIAEMMGVPTAMTSQLLDWSHSMVAMYQFGRSRAVEDAAVRATGEFSTFIRELAGERRHAPGDDLISVLLEAAGDNDRLSEQELVTNCILLLNAGHEATVHGLGNAIRALLGEGSDVAALFDTPERGLWAADELLRFDPPLHLFTRYVLEDLVFDGVELRAGTQVALLLGAANHDARRFPRPDRLDFERGGTGHVAFGAGIHFCIGAPLARLEMMTALPILFSRLPKLALDGQPRYARRYHFRGLESLRVVW